MDDVTALRDALLDELTPITTMTIGQANDIEWGMRNELAERLDALIAAVRAETLAGSEVVEAAREAAAAMPADHCPVCRSGVDTWLITHADWCPLFRLYRALAATPPTPALTAARSEFRALVDEARANHVRWEHEAEVLEECNRPLCLGARVLLWPDPEDPRSSALPPPTPALTAARLCECGHIEATHGNDGGCRYNRLAGHCQRFALATQGGPLTATVTVRETQYATGGNLATDPAPGEVEG